MLELKKGKTTYIFQKQIVSSKGEIEEYLILFWGCYYMNWCRVREADLGNFSMKISIQGNLY